MVKKIISGALSAAILFTTAATSGFLKTPGAGETQTTRTTVDPNMDEYQLEASNSLANFFKKQKEDHSLNPDAELLSDKKDSEFVITNLGFDAETGIVHVASSQSEDCRIRISVIEETTESVYQEVICDVKKGKSIVTETKADTQKLPQYYWVYAELIDKKGKVLSNTFKFNTYTKIIQDISATTVYDFEEAQVINYDEQDDTNFIVLSEDTVQAESNEAENTLVDADYENNTFVFENITESIQYLQSGDYLYVQPDEENIIAVSVDDVEIDGSTATIKGNDDIEEMFDFIKFETETDMQNAIVDTSTADESLIFPGHEDEEEFILEDNEPLYFENNPDILWGLPFGLEFGFEKTAGISFGDDDNAISSAIESNGSLEFGGSLSLTTTLNFYMKGDYISMSFILSPKFEVHLTLELEDEPFNKLLDLERHDVPPIVLAKVKVPTNIPGLVITIIPELVIQLRGEISINATYAPEFGFKYDDKNLDLISEFDKDKLTWDLTVKGEIFIGIHFNPGLAIVSEKVCCMNLDITIGFVITIASEANLSDIIDVKNSEWSESNKVAVVDSDDEMFHSCYSCWTLDFALRLQFGYTFQLLGQVISPGNRGSLEAGQTNLTKYNGVAEENGKTFDIKIPELSFYLSFPKNNGHPSCGLRRAYGKYEDEKTCPFRKFRTEFEIKNTNSGAPIEGLEVIVDGLSQFTDKNGKAAFYCDPGNYDYTVKYDEHTLFKRDFTVTNSKILVKKNIDFSFDENNAPIVAAEEDSIESGQVYTTAATTTPVTTSKTTTVLAKNEGELMAEALQLGENVWGIIYRDGYMLIYGDGDMYDSNSARFRYIDRVESVSFKDSDPDNGKHITSISNDLFNGATSLETVYLSDNIQKIGDFAFNDCSKLKYFRYGGEDDQSKTLRLPKDLTHIGYCAFNNCKSAAFDELIMPDNISYIGGQAFSNCNGLTYLKINGNDATIDDAAFYKCHNLKEAYFGSGVKTFEDNILSDCYSVEKLTLPRVDETFHRNIGELFYVKESSDPDKTYITSYYGTPKSLTSITVLGGKSIYTNTFRRMSYLKEIDLPEGITNIGIYAFADCTNVELDPKKLLKDVEIIGERAFQNCTSIDFGKIVFSDNIKTIGMCAFDKCSGITSLMVYGKETSIDKYAFSSCSNLKEAEFGSGVTSIGEYVLSDCLSVEKLTVPRLEDISSNGIAQMFYVDEPSDPKKVYDGAGFAGTPKSLTSVTVLSGKSINANAFQGMSYLNEINIPEGITQIGNRAFENCTNVKLDINKLLKNVESIGEYAFSNCSATEFGDIVLPEKLKKIESGTFYNCTGITGVYFYKNMESVGYSAFHGCNSIDKVQYEGTDEEWDEFEKSIETDNDPILRKDILTCNADAPAVKNTPFAKGDTNGDGVIELTDAILIMQAIANPDKYGVGGTAKYHMTLEGLEAADIENDGVTVGDALMIQEYLLGLRPTLNLA